MTAFRPYAPLQFQPIPMLPALLLQLEGLRLIYAIPASPPIIPSFTLTSTNGAVYIENAQVECSRRCYFGDIRLTFNAIEIRADM